MLFTPIDIFFFAYMFIGLYMTIVLILIYLRNKEEMSLYPPSKLEPVSIVVPCYNDSKMIGKAIDSLANLDYPKEMLEIIIVDDKSTDNSLEIAREHAKKYTNVKVIANSRNSGGAAEPTNIGIRAAKYNYIAVADSDSIPERDIIKKMIGFLQNDQSVAAVTCAVLVNKPQNFVQKIQAIEYALIAWSRKLLDCIDSVYVTPGPFALYKKDKLIGVGMFDTKNMTQDIEIVWRLLSKGYKARMCLATKVFSEAPDKWKDWFKQRVRWNIGGNQTLYKYKSDILKKGMFGFFIIPFFAISLILGLAGLCLFFYLWVERLLVSYLTTKYSLYADTSVFRFYELSFTPSILNIFGGALFILGFAYLMFGLYSIKKISKEELPEANLFNLLFFSIVYLTAYPAIMIWALWKQFRGKYSW